MSTFKEARKMKNKLNVEIPNAPDQSSKQQNYVVSHDESSETDGYGCRQFNVKKVKVE